MGGSEEAVYYLSIELAKIGYNVEIFTDLSDIDKGRKFIYTNGYVVWNHLNNMDINEYCYVFIAWRYSISLSLSKSANKRYLWLHDLVPSSTLPTSFFDIFDGIFVQSQFHKFFIENNMKNNNRSATNLININNRISNQSLETSKIFIVPNGIIITNDLDGPNHNNIFIYGSAPNRGLEYVLRSWKRIKINIPSAILKIYYGFTDSVIKSMKESMGETQFSVWYEDIQNLLQQDGVEYIGSVNHYDLTIAYRESGFLLYPTTYPETGCITVLRAMSCGCIPITSRFKESVLYDLTFLHDMGPTNPLTANIIKNNTEFNNWMNTWVDSVIGAFYIESNQLDNHRIQMKLHVRKSYSWEQTAKVVKDIFDL